MKEEEKFLVESLQRRKIIMALEAIMVNSSVGLGIFLVDRYIQYEVLKNSLIFIGGLFGISYAIWAGVGNIKKHNQIRKIYKDG